MIHVLSKLIDYIIDHHKSFLIGFIVMIVIASYFLISDLRIDNTLKIWFSEGDKNYQNFIEFQDQYGNDDVITILVSYPYKVYERDAIKDMIEIEKDLSRLRHVDKVYSFGSSNFFKIFNNEISIEKNVENVPVNNIEKKRIIDRLNSFPAIKKTFLTKDERSHLIVVRLRSFEDIEIERDNIVKDIKASIEKILPNYQIAGLAVINEAMNETVARESSLFFILSFTILIMFVALIIKKRRFFLLIIPIVILPIVFTYGLMAASGQSLNMISMTLPTILMVYSFADAIHLLNNYLNFSVKYPKLDKKRLINISMCYSFKPCFYASLTTMLAYLTFCFSPLAVLKGTGLFAFLGIGFAFISVYIISIIGFVLLDHPSREKEWKIGNFMDKWSHGFSAHVIKITTLKKNSLIHIFLILIPAGILFISSLDINTYPVEYLDEKTKVRQDSKIIEEKMGAYLPFEIIIKSTNGERIISNNNLNFLEQFQDSLEAMSSIYNPNSILEVVKYLNQQLSNDDYQYKIPETDVAISQILLLYEMGEHNRLDELVDKAYTEARITAQVKMLSAKDFGNILDEVRQLFSRLNGQSYDLEITPKGYLPLYVHIVSYITSSLLYSFLGAFMMVGLMIFLFVKNIRITLTCLLANIIPISVIIILLTNFNIPLDMGTVMIGAILLGISVDDTIHIINAYKENYKSAIGNIKSINRALKFTMPALLSSSIALIFGFLILSLSSLSSIHNFGILCSASVAFAFIADIYFLPSLLKIQPGSEISESNIKTSEK
jgi:predicted RND superfamily exporter protein